MRVLKRFTRFVGSLSAELICLPLKCVRLCAGNYGEGDRARSAMCTYASRGFQPTRGLPLVLAATSATAK